MNIGQRVKLVRVPDGIEDTDELKTRTLFDQCLGKTFLIADHQGDLLALDVGEVRDKPSYMETIYVEPSCVEVVSD